MRPSLPTFAARRVSSRAPLQELEEEAKRADKTAYEDSDDDRKRKGGSGKGKPPATKSKH